jgi:hypothetical protein
VLKYLKLSFLAEIYICCKWTLIWWMINISNVFSFMSYWPLIRTVLSVKWQGCVLDNQSSVSGKVRRGTPNLLLKRFRGRGTNWSVKLYLYSPYMPS